MIKNLLRLEFLPAPIFLNRVWFESLITLEPEPKPVDIRLLRCKTILRLLENMLTVCDVEQIYRFFLLIERRIYLPFLKQ